MRCVQWLRQERGSGDSGKRDEGIEPPSPIKNLPLLQAGLIILEKSFRRKDGADMEIISTKNAPGAIGPYSQAIILNGVVYTSGQVPLSPETGEVVGTTIEEQAEQVMKNLGAVLEAAGSSYEKTVKTTCFLADMNDFAAFNEVYGKYFTGKPARSCVAVKTLPKNVLCEVEAVAAVE